ncbi:hypothetical protein FWK35_00014495 [Aphis craccivora]|uniref:Uncharacterized protein n=1 Tax=Aphis craccivora TaxID=307492 RepID=A0A6G0ZD21_APHCR|nr:hypothetical protein FWK35_00014495 [Aphis craccivora]
MFGKQITIRNIYLFDS